MIEPQLIEALGAVPDSERRFAAQEIGDSGDPGAVGVLVTQLRREGSRAVKEAILRSLSRIWGSSPVESIIELLRDDDPFVRAEAAEMLQRRAGDAIESLNALMRSDDKDLRKFSIDILSQSAATVPDSLYLAALKDEDINVVISTIESIGAGRRTAYLEPVLAIALSSPQPMAVCACLDTLAMIGTRETLSALRAKFPSAAAVPGFYLHPFLKLLGGTGGPEAIEEVCGTIRRKGASVYEVSIDALTRIASRHSIVDPGPGPEELLCGLLKLELDSAVRFRLIRLLGHFAGSARVALEILPYIHDKDRLLGLAAVESLASSSDPLVEASLRTLLATESDPEISEELEELLGRRPRWNSPLSSSLN
jgi:HEAT repeat protein